MAKFLSAPGEVPGCPEAHGKPLTLSLPPLLAVEVPTEFPAVRTQQLRSQVPATARHCAGRPGVLPLSPSVPPGGRWCRCPNFLERQETESKDGAGGWGLGKPDSGCQLQGARWELPGPPSSADGWDPGTTRGRSSTTAHWAGAPGIRHKGTSVQTALQAVRQPPGRPGDGAPQQGRPHHRGTHCPSICGQ